MAQQPLVAVVTGANRGIGLAICQRIASGYAGSLPLVLYAASRKGAPLPIKDADVVPNVKILPSSLVVTEKSSVDDLISRIRDDQGGLDVLINSAGLYHYDEKITAQQRKETFDVNYRATLRVCKTAIPVMRPGGRIVNLSSQSGQLLYFAEPIQARFINPDLTFEELDALVAEYNDAASKGKAVAQGWPPMTYFTSKAAMNSVTRLLARDNPNLLINCCCPGWVATNLGSQAGAPPKTPNEGATIPLRLAFDDINSVSGRYWANDSVAGKGNGRVQPW